MATDEGFVEYVQSQSGWGRELSFKKMFGEYALYLHDKVVALACDNQLYLKPTEEGRSLAGKVQEHAPYPGAKLHLLLDEQIEDRELLRQLFEATAKALPLPKPKGPRSLAAPSSSKTAPKAPADVAHAQGSQRNRESTDTLRANLPDAALTSPPDPAISSLEDSVMKPLMNIDDVEFDDVEKNGLYTSSRGQIGDHIGAKKLGYNLTVLPPGKAQCPFHCHHGEEEMFLILEGDGELRFGGDRYPIRKHDVIACPPGGPDVAHQIINTGMTTMRYLALSTLVDVEACEYPDSRKVLIVTGQRGQRGLRKMFRAENTFDYYDRESTEQPR